MLSRVQRHARIQRSEVIDLCHLSRDQEVKLLKRVKADGKLVQHGERRGAFYTLAGYEPL